MIKILRKLQGSTSHVMYFCWPKSILIILSKIIKLKKFQKISGLISGHFRKLRVRQNNDILVTNYSHLDRKGQICSTVLT